MSGHLTHHVETRTNRTVSGDHLRLSPSAETAPSNSRMTSAKARIGAQP
jgi:hypothetical protein